MYSTLSTKEDILPTIQLITKSNEGYGIGALSRTLSPAGVHGAFDEPRDLFNIDPSVFVQSYYQNAYVSRVWLA